MSEDLYRALIPEGMHLSESKDTLGALRALLFENGTNRLSGPPELTRVGGPEEPVERALSAISDPQRRVLGAIIAAAIVTTGAIVVAKKAPRIKLWWRHQAPLKVTGQVTRARELRAPTTDDTAVVGGRTHSDAMSAAASRDFSKAVDLAVEASENNRDREGAERRLVAALVAAAFIAEQIRSVSSVPVDDGDALRELKGAMERLTDELVTARINLMLQADPTLLDGETSAEFVKIFGGGREVDGEYVPLRNASVREALRLTSGPT